MFPPFFCISQDTSNSLSDLSKSFRKIYRLENVCANVLNQMGSVKMTLRMQEKMDFNDLILKNFPGKYTRTYMICSDPAKQIPAYGPVYPCETFCIFALTSNSLHLIDTLLPRVFLTGDEEAYKSKWKLLTVLPTPANYQR